MEWVAVRAINIAVGFGKSIEHRLLNLQYRGRLISVLEEKSIRWSEK